MSQTWSVPGWVVLATLGTALLVVVLLVVALLRSHRRQAAVLDAARAEVAALAARLEAVEQATLPAPAVRADDTEYVVTMLGRDEDEAPLEPASAVPGPLFADLVLREGVVQAASLAAGLRRALAPETRHRIRFEMRREVKRARKQRRADLREAKRQFDANQRAAEVPA
ncbi:MAG: hypothetical protein JWN84_3319 [Nocardioides sp.]|nr:hypothetical protein [Nocardioides sp.]